MIVSIKIMLPRCCSILIILAAICFAQSTTSLADSLTTWFSLDGPKLIKKNLGQRIAYWAGSFVGTPYDTDPLGKYVREERIVVDDAVDCMYLTFRAVELAMSRTPEETIENALNLRFRSKGKIVDGRVSNYDDRFEYGEDMIDSGKWGKEITGGLGKPSLIKGSRGRSEILISPKYELVNAINKSAAGPGLPLMDGDIMFFIKDPSKRVVEEIVGHIGIISIKEGVPYLIHASGRKAAADSPGSGIVKSVILREYLENMKFIGVRVTRFE